MIIFQFCALLSSVSRIDALNLVVEFELCIMFVVEDITTLWMKIAGLPSSPSFSHQCRLSSDSFLANLTPPYESCYAGRACGVTKALIHISWS